jgi:hypothetical protein
MFGSDEYADIGNIAVLRDDNGADAYEVSNYLIAEYEDGHLFTDYRRKRTNFSLRSAFMRSFRRYNAKLMEITKGFALYNEIFQGTGSFEYLTEKGTGEGFMRANALAASLVFDHFTRMLTRPTAGEHFAETALDPGKKSIFRADDQLPTVTKPRLPLTIDIPLGTQGVGSDFSVGGRPLHNALDQTKGYYATDYQLSVGSYYDKTLVPYMLTESVDRFISQSRDDFVDGRYRNLSFASLFPEGMRRLIANSLTEDSDILGWRVAAIDGKPETNDDGTLKRPLGYRAWWSTSPEVCWPARGRLNCSDYAQGEVGPASADVPTQSIAIDPEIGFEVQKFIAFHALLNLPENWKQDWVDMMRLWIVGGDSKPEFSPAETIAWRDPSSGQLYIAHRYGTETIDGKIVQKGISARILEWANTLTKAAYEIESEDPVTGELLVKRYVDDSACPAGSATCKDQPVQRSAAFAIRVKNYKSIVDYMHMLVSELGFFSPEWRGVR